MSTLQIYKASAGSGKTYRLTVEYLVLLFEKVVNYKHILAVTFTNKATEEMKGRIIRELYKLSLGKETIYRAELMNRLNLSHDVLKEQAKLNLQSILHDYSRFSVETIDSFFQRVIQAFVMEIGLQAGFRVELDSQSVLSEVVDLMMYNIDRDDELRKWLVRFAENRIEEGRSWNFKRDIISLGQELFNEKFSNAKEAIEAKIKDKSFLQNYQKKLYQIKDEIEKKLVSKADALYHYFKKNDIALYDFAYGKAGVGGYIKKIMDAKFESPGQRVEACMDDTEKWVTKKSSKKDKILNALNNGGHRLFNELINYFNEKYPDYYTCKSILNFIYTLGILTDISLAMRDYADEKNIFMISDTAYFLNLIINNNEAPFIYEKVGNYFNYYMIDEFQDTSVLQWENFRPLIHNSLADNHTAFVVGDVKQSIYRWRNSDWSILSEKINNDFPGFLIKQTPLKNNWRSKENIVHFNNAFFQAAVDILKDKFQFSHSELFENVVNSDYSNKFQSAYDEIFQHLPDNNDNAGGHIYLKAYEDSNEKSWTAHSKEDLINNIKYLQECRFKLKDMAILVRNKKEGKEIANYLVEYREKNPSSTYRYDFISNDSLFIASSTAVKIIISAIRYVIYPDDDINFSLLVSEYQKYVLKKNTDYGGKSDDVFFTELVTKKGWYLPKEFQEEFDSLKKLSLYEITERLIDIFNLGNNPDNFIYLMAFQDLIKGYDRDRNIGMNAFLDWWEERGVNETITVNEDQDAIRILTIHKSKGLEFRAVLIPFCNWSLDHEASLTNILWCKPQKKPYNELALVPVKYVNDLQKSWFSEEYYKEKFQTHVDHLNLLYVAFTRAVDFLHIGIPVLNKKKNNSIKKVGELIGYVLKNKLLNIKMDDVNIDLNSYWDDKKQIFSLSDIKMTSENNSSATNDIYLKNYISVPLRGRFAFRLHSEDYFDFFTKRESNLNYGRMMHVIFQQIKTHEDIDRILQKNVMKGLLSKRESEDLKVNITKQFRDEKIHSWFSKTWKIMTEMEILDDDGTVYRPDRVLIDDNETLVIDYKFGKQMEKIHHEQVKTYCKLLSKMNYSNIAGYLWYVELGKVVQV